MNLNTSCLVSVFILVFALTTPKGMFKTHIPRNAPGPIARQPQEKPDDCNLDELKKQLKDVKEKEDAMNKGVANTLKEMDKLKASWDKYVESYKAELSGEQKADFEKAVKNYNKAVEKYDVALSKANAEIAKGVDPNVAKKDAGADDEGDIREEMKGFMKEMFDAVRTEEKKDPNPNEAKPTKLDKMKGFERWFQDWDDIYDKNLDKLTRQGIRLKEIVKEREALQKKLREEEERCLKPISALPDYEVDTKTAAGLFTASFTTPNGKVNVNLTDDLAAGDTFSGTVEEEPAGRSETERSQNKSELNGYVLDIQQQQTKLAERTLTRTLPASLTIADRTLRLLRNGKEVARTEIPISTEAQDTLTGFVLPTGGQQGKPLKIKGPCNGRFNETDFVKIGQKTVETLAESPRTKIVRDSSDEIGPTKIECHENGKVAECPFRNLGIKLSADKLSLLKGENTKLHVQVLGLAGINQDVPLDLVNHSPSVIDLEGGVEQHITIYMKDVIADGTYSTDRTLTGIVRGGFVITGIVRWTDTCDDDVGGEGFRKELEIGGLKFEFNWDNTEHIQCANKLVTDPEYLDNKNQPTKDEKARTGVKCPDCKECKKPCSCILFHRPEKPKDQKELKNWVFKKKSNPGEKVAYEKGEYKCVCVQDKPK
jgi:Skp family chaperone for outer membrane proteins